MAEWPREIKRCRTQVEPVATDGLDNPVAWLQARAGELRQHWGADIWLLVHSDDGVNWGRLDVAGAFIISHQALLAQQAQSNHPSDQKEIAAALRTCPQLRRVTLQQARLFAPAGELLLWRDGDGQFHSRLIQEAAGPGAWEEYFDEPQYLWGTHGIALAHDFTLLRDGAQGLRHAVPVPKTLLVGAGGKFTPPRLVVRHYLAKDAVARVAASRLVQLS